MARVLTNGHVDAEFLARHGFCGRPRPETVPGEREDMNGRNGGVPPDEPVRAKEFAERQPTVEEFRKPSVDFEESNEPLGDPDAF